MIPRERKTLLDLLAFCTQWTSLHHHTANHSTRELWFFVDCAFFWQLFRFGNRCFCRYTLRRYIPWMRNAMNETEAVQVCEVRGAGNQRWDFLNRLSFNAMWLRWVWVNMSTSELLLLSYDIYVPTIYDLIFFLGGECEFLETCWNHIVSSSCCRNIA